MKTVVVFLVAVCLAGCGYGIYGACAYDPAMQMAEPGKWFSSSKNGQLNYRQSSRGPLDCDVFVSDITCTNTAGDSLLLVSNRDVVIEAGVAFKPDKRLEARAALGPTYQLIRGDIRLTTTQAAAPGVRRKVYVDGTNCWDNAGLVETIQFNHVELTLAAGQ